MRWQLLAFLLTLVSVTSGFDWLYFQVTRSATIQAILFPPVIVGFVVPFILPLVLLAIGAIRKNIRLQNAGFGIGQAGLLGLAISSLYKVFTGRMGPYNFHSIGTVLNDISRGFRFGFYRGGAYDGWPSSHTAVAFAMSAAIIALYPKNKWVKYIALFYAFYIGIGVSVNIHWFSDFVAGAIIGTVIGLSVGKSFWNRHRTLESKVQ